MLNLGPDLFPESMQWTKAFDTLTITEKSTHICLVIEEYIKRLASSLQGCNIGMMKAYQVSV